MAVNRGDQELFYIMHTYLEPASLEFLLCSLERRCDVGSLGGVRPSVAMLPLSRNISK